MSEWDEKAREAASTAETVLPLDRATFAAGARWHREALLSGIPETCAACGKPAEGFAMIGDERYCHPDEGPSCYMGGRR